MLASFLTLLSLVSTPGPITAVRVEEAPSIDGVLDDEIWREACVCSTHFYQFSPDYGAVMTEPTEIRVLYDDGAIYFGFYMTDPGHDQMINALTPRDNYITGEWMAILLDTWGDGREATSFEVSLANSQMDSKLNPYGGWDYSWDAVWRSGTAQVPGGWTAEFAIPFSCLRFDQNSEEQTWTVNFQRILSRTSENGWYVLSESGAMAELETFAPLEGIRGIQGSLGAEIRPYGAGRSFHYQASDEWDHDYNAGVDVKVGLGSGLAADFTLNPDFGQVEADAVEMNLSHFELFRQEKRPFFLESQNLFHMPFRMFYSRRIGAVAPNGDVIPIIGGAKISGSLGGGYRIGFLNAVTASISEEGEGILPAMNYGALRVVREFGTYSYVGISATSREIWEQDEFPAEHNGGASLDCGFEVPGNHLVELAAAGSWNSDMDSDGAFRFNMNKIRSTTGYSFGAEYVGENFDVNATGYTTYTGYREGWGNFWKNIRPELTFREIGFDLGMHYSETLDGDITDRNVNLGGHAVLKSGVNFRGSLNYHGSYFDPYEGPEGREYGSHTDFYFRAATNHYDRYYIMGGVGGGQWGKGGTFQNYNLGVNMRPCSSLEVGLDGSWFITGEGTNYNWEISDWDRMDTDWKSLILRTNYIFNPDLHLRLFSQYSRFSSEYQATGGFEGSEITANLLFSWQYLPGSMFYLLMENRFQEDEEGSFGTPDYGVYAKITWFLPI